jgi:hypothetical protein
MRFFSRLPAMALMVGLALTALVLTVTLSSGISAQQKVGLLQALTPAPTPPDARRVAILTLRITSTTDGKLDGIHLEKGRIVGSYAPHVLGVRGEWTVILVSHTQQRLTFGIEDPRRLSSFDPHNVQDPHTTKLLPDVTVELVVPLNDQLGKDLRVVQINIADQNQQQVFSTPVDYSAWTLQG